MLPGQIGTDRTNARINHNVDAAAAGLWPEAVKGSRNMSQTKAAGMRDALSAHCHPLRLLSHRRSVAQEEFCLSILYPPAAAILWGGTKPGSNPPKFPAAGSSPAPSCSWMETDSGLRVGEVSTRRNCSCWSNSATQLPRKDPKPKGEWQDFISSSSLFPQFLMDAVSTFMLSENGCFTAA